MEKTAFQNEEKQDPDVDLATMDDIHIAEEKEGSQTPIQENKATPATPSPEKEHIESADAHMSSVQELSDTHQSSSSKKRKHQREPVQSTTEENKTEDGNKRNNNLKAQFAHLKTLEGINIILSLKEDAATYSFFELNELMPNMVSNPNADGESAFFQARQETIAQVRQLKLGNLIALYEKEYPLMLEHAQILGARIKILQDLTHLLDKAWKEVCSALEKVEQTESVVHPDCATLSNALEWLQPQYDDLVDIVKTLVAARAVCLRHGYSKKLRLTRWKTEKQRGEEKALIPSSRSKDRTSYSPDHKQWKLATARVMADKTKVYPRDPLDDAPALVHALAPHTTRVEWTELLGAQYAPPHCFEPDPPTSPSDSGGGGGEEGEQSEGDDIQSDKDEGDGDGDESDKEEAQREAPPTQLVLFGWDPDRLSNLEVQSRLLSLELDLSEDIHFPRTRDGKPPTAVLTVRTFKQREWNMVCKRVIKIGDAYFGIRIKAGITGAHMAHHVTYVCQIIQSSTRAILAPPLPLSSRGIYQEGT